MKMVLRWGILGAGKISHDFVSALGNYPATQPGHPAGHQHRVVAVAARSLSSAKEFAKKHDIPKAYEGYEAIAKDPDVDIAYVGLLNIHHLAVSKLMLDNGKHLLCEKPLTVNKKQTQELIEYAERKNLFLMEAVWSRCNPLYEEIRNIIDSGAIGDVTQVNVDFGFVLEHLDRINLKDFGGGAILDIGVYTLQFSQFIYKGLKPQSVIPWGHLNEHKVEDRAGAIITYPDGSFSVVSTNIKAQLANTAYVYGTKGTIIIPDTFFAPLKIIVKPAGGSTFPERTICKDLPKTSAMFNYTNSAALAYEAEEVRKCIEEGLLESPKMPHSDTLELAALLDAWRKGTGNVFVQDG